jgi:hypothetical protein
VSLRGNYAVLALVPGRQFGAGFGNTPAYKSSTALKRNRYLGGVPRLAATPAGYLPPYSWVIPVTGGDMATFTLIRGTSTMTGGAAAGVNISSTIDGVGDLTVTGQLVVSAVATLTGSGVVSDAGLLAVLQASATLSGTGDLTAGLDALGHVIATLTGTASESATLTATGTLAAEITPFTDLSPQSLAGAVWAAVAADNNDPLTMGEKLNGAGSAGDPWSTVLPGSYTTSQAGGIVSLIHKVLRNKTVTDPATGTITVYDDDGSTVLLTADLFEDAAGTQPYDGAGAERRERLE